MGVESNMEKQLVWKDPGDRSRSNVQCCSWCLCRSRSGGEGANEKQLACQSFIYQMCAVSCGAPAPWQYQQMQAV